MSFFQIGFIVVSLAFCAFDILGAVSSFKKGESVGTYLGLTCVGCALVVLSYLGCVFSSDYFVHSCITSLHYICVVFMLLCMTFFVGHFVELKESMASSVISKLILFLGGLDATCFIVNPFKEIILSFVDRHTAFDTFAVEGRTLFFGHWGLCILLMGLSFFLLVYKWRTSAQVDRRKYWFAMLALGAVELFSIISEMFPGFLGRESVDYSPLVCSAAAYAFYWSVFLFSRERFVFNHSVPLEQRTNVMFLVTGIFGSACGLLITLASSVHYVGILAVGLVIVGMMLTSFVARKTGHGDLGFWILISGILIAMPTIWLSAGGVNSGVNCWYVYEFFYIAFALKGRGMYIAMSIAFLLDGGSYLFAYHYPDYVFMFDNMVDTYISTMASTFVVGITVVVTVLYQKNIYYDEQAALEEAYKGQERLKREAENANHAKSDFLASMSHEIRTPINAVLGMDEMILRGGTPEEIVEYAKNIKQAGNMLLSLVNDVLDFSKIESGKMNIVPVEYRLATVVGDLVTMITPRMNERGLEFKTDISGDIPTVLFGDDFRLRQIVANLLTNAVKYTSRGSVILKIGCEFVGDQCCLMVSVKDTGIGVREEDKTRLFESFRRLDETRNRSIEGTGLGLSITQRLLELMGSCLQIESEYGAGSDFSFKLVQGVVDWTPVGDLKQKLLENHDQVEVFHESFEAPAARILVVDDNRMNLLVVKGLLKNSRMQIDTAMSGQECLDKVVENCYHIILMDHMMPQMDGVEALERMRSMKDNRSAGAKVIALTANAVKGARESYLAYGFDDFLAKPVKGALLEQMILKYLPRDVAYMKNSDDAVPEGSAPLIDFVKGEELCDHDRNLYRDVLLSLPAEHFDYYLQEYFEKSDWKNYGIKVHALKSCLACVGAEKTSQWAKRLELAAKEENVKLIMAEHNNLMDELRAILAEIQKYCN